jgi:hypothetical protein
MSIGLEDDAIVTIPRRPNRWHYEAVQFPRRTLPDWGNVYAMLDNISALHDDWDGEGAIRPDERIIRVTSELIKQIRNFPDGPIAPTIIRATPDGNICVEWHTGSAARVEAEVGQNAIEWMVFNENGLQGFITVPLTESH